MKPRNYEDTDEAPRSLDFSRIDDDPTNDEGAFGLSDDIFGRNRREIEDDFESMIDAAGE